MQTQEYTWNTRLQRTVLVGGETLRAEWQCAICKGWFSQVKSSFYRHRLICSAAHGLNVSSRAASTHDGANSDHNDGNASEVQGAAAEAGQAGHVDVETGPGETAAEQAEQVAPGAVAAGEGDAALDADIDFLLEEVMTDVDTDGDEDELPDPLNPVMAQLQQDLSSIGLTPSQTHEVYEYLQQHVGGRGEVYDDDEDGLPDWLFDEVDEDDGLHPNDATLFSSKANIYRDRRHDPICPNSRASVLSVCFMLLCWKIDHHVRDTAFDVLLGMLSQYIMPERNLLPPSLYLLKQFIRVESHASYMWHVCEGGCTSWPPIPPSQWAGAQDTCRQCGGCRFVTKPLAGGRSQLRPSKVMWYFAIPEVIKELHEDPEFSAARGQGRTFDKPGSFWGSPEFERLDKATHKAITRDGASVCEWGFDFGQVFTFIQHSSGFLFYRNRDLPAELVGSRKWHRVLLVIPGPKEPKCMDGYLEPLCADMAKLGNTGIQVTPSVRDADGKVSKGQTFTYKEYLCGISADQPARAKLMYSIGSWTAYLMCPFCALVGTLVAGVVRFLGYTKPVLADRGSAKGKSFQIGVDDRNRVLTSNAIKSCAEMSEQLPRKDRATYAASHLRMHGKSPIFQHLQYVDAKALWLVPFGHAFLYGVLKDFLKAILAKKSKHSESQQLLPSEKRISSKGRLLLQLRASTFVDHPQAGRTYKDMVTKLGNFTMEDYSRAITVYFPALFQPLQLPHSTIHVLPPGLVKKAYGHLRRFAEFHILPQEFSTIEDFHSAADAARQELLEYAKIAELDFKAEDDGQCTSKFCTANLHILADRLTDQVKERGLTQDWGELWVERMVQQCKSSTKYRTHSNPETMISNGLLLDNAVAGMHTQLADGMVELLSYEEWKACTARTSHQLADGGLDTALDKATGLLLDAGGQLSNEGELAVLKAKLLTCVRNNPNSIPDGTAWESVWANATLWVHTRALLPGSQALVTSSSYTRSRGRDGSYVLQYYVSGAGRSEEWWPFVGQVSKFIRVQHPDAPEKALRFAMCDFYKYHQPFKDADIGESFRVKVVPEDDGATYDSKDYPVLTAQSDRFTLVYVSQKLIQRALEIISAHQVQIW